MAIDQALKNQKVCRLFLLAVPIKLSLKPKMPLNSLKVYFDNIRPDDYEALAAKQCYGIQKDKNPFHYMGWIPRLWELFVKIRQTRQTVTQITTPCSVYQSEKDEMVSTRSVKYLENNPWILVSTLNASGHYYYDKEDLAFLLTEFHTMLSADT